jgi:protease I
LDPLLIGIVFEVYNRIVGKIIFTFSKLSDMGTLSGKKVAILTENGFEEVELTSPMKALQEAGASVDIVSPQKYNVKAWDHDHWSIELPVDVQIDDANVDDYDALFIPGGVLNPDQMRTNPDCVDFAQQFLEESKPVAAICHGPQLLIETGLLRGKNMTSFPSIRSDLENAGAHWLDVEVVTDNGLTTSRSPNDLKAFNKRLIEEIAESNIMHHSPIF